MIKASFLYTVCSNIGICFNPIFYNFADKYIILYVMNRNLNTLLLVVALTAAVLPVPPSSAFAVKCGNADEMYNVVPVDAPFEMPAIREFVFPAREFSITKYGARTDDVKANIKAFRKAVDACAKAGEVG